MLSLRSVSFHARETQILEGVELDIAPGQMVGLIGHNGSGKSTLIKLLARQHTPSAGSCQLDGRPYAQWRASDFARRIGYLPQQLPRADGLRVREFVHFGRYPWRGLLGRSTSDDHQRVEEAMQRADVLAMADRVVDELSGGERQRVWIALLLAQDTRYLILDEPISALDLAHQVQILALLRDLTKTGVGVVLVLHDINMAAHFCDRLVALRAGRLFAAGTSGALMRSDTLEAIYGVPMTVMPRPHAQSMLAVVGV